MNQETIKTVLSSAGIGDFILSLQCSHFILAAGTQTVNICAARSEVAGPLNHIFKGVFHVEQESEEYINNHAIIHDEKLRQKFESKYGDFYYVLPDLLYQNPFAFPYEKYNTNPQLIRSTRLLTSKYKPQKTVYLALATTTDGYLHHNCGELIKQIGQKLPDYNIYFPMITSWNGKYINYGSLDNLPTNVHIEVDPTFETAFEKMKESCFAICADNGPSHIFYQLGCPRILLDPWYGRIPWISRWREDYSESIPIQLDPVSISELTKISVTVPETNLIPKIAALQNFVVETKNWKNSFLTKY